VRESGEAESLLREAIALDPTHAVAWAYLGALLLERAAIGKSEDAFSVALTHGPEEFLVRLKRGEAHLRLGRTYDALEELTHAVMLPPPDVQAGAYAHAARCNPSAGKPGRCPHRRGSGQSERRTTTTFHAMARDAPPYR